MFISIVTETYPPEVNGVANTLQHMVNGLAGRGHQVQLVRLRPAADSPSTPGAGPAPQMPGVVEQFTAGLPIPGYHGLQFGLPADLRLKRMWRDARPQVVYVATEGPLGMSALATCRRLGIPCATGLHTLFQQYSRHYGLGLIAPLIQRHLKRFHNRSQTTLVPTRAMVEMLSAQGFHNVQTWSRGVDTGLFDPARRDPELRHQWGLKDNELAMVYVGRIAPEKNIELLLHSYRTLQAYRPGSRLIMVGDGPACQKVAKRCPEVILSGVRRGEELARHYATGDLFLFPSLTDTFGNVVLEAMASGLPVVAFNQAAAAELIIDGRHGRLVTGEDDDAFVAAVLDAASDQTRLAHWGQAARTRAIAHGWPALIHQLENIFQQLAERGISHEDAA